MVVSLRATADSFADGIMRSARVGEEKTGMIQAARLRCPLAPIVTGDPAPLPLLFNTPQFFL